MFQNYSYDGTLKQIANEKNENVTANKTGAGFDEFENVLQNQENILRDTPNKRYDARMKLGDPESADIRIVGLGHSACGNSCLMLRLFYNEYDDEPEDNPLLQWEQHQMQYQFETEQDVLRISYFDLKGFDDIITKQEMDERIRDTINHSFNVILLYYSIDERISFVDSNGYSVQDIKTYVEYWMSLLDTKKFMLILVGNKLDVEHDNERRVSTIEAQNIAKSWGNIPFIEVSAKTGENIKQLLDVICYIYTRRFEEIDGDLNEAALFDEDKCDNTKTIVQQDEEYEEYVEEKQVETFEQIMLQQNQLNVNYDHDEQKYDQQEIETVAEIINDDDNKADKVNPESNDEKNKLDEQKYDEKTVVVVDNDDNDDKKHEKQIATETALVINNDDKSDEIQIEIKHDAITPVEADKVIDNDKKEELHIEPQTIINNDDKLDEMETKPDTKETVIPIKKKKKVTAKKERKSNINEKPIPIKKKANKKKKTKRESAKVKTIPIKKKKELTSKKENIKKKKKDSKRVSKKIEPKKIPIKKSDKILVKKKPKKKTVQKRKSQAKNVVKAKTVSTTTDPTVQSSWMAGGPSVISFFDEKPIAAKPRPKNTQLTKHVMSVKEFNNVPLKSLISGDDSLKDNYDIAKKICKFYDSQFGDTDTVCVVAEKGKQPSISFFCKGNYVRKHKNILGKHILIYRACKHQAAKEPIHTAKEFENFVKKISIENEKNNVNTICDLMDKKFGLGCHYARSTTKKARYDVYSRFSDKYDCGFKLPSGAYIIAWRR